MSVSSITAPLEPKPYLNEMISPDPCLPLSLGVYLEHTIARLANLCLFEDQCMICKLYGLVWREVPPFLGVDQVAWTEKGVQCVPANVA